MKLNIYTLLTLFMLCSCTTQQKKDKDEFQVVEKLRFIDLGLNDVTFKPQSIEIFDSLLLISDPIGEDLYQLVNLHTNTIVCKGGRRGEGPNDILYGAIMDKIDDDRFQVIDVASKKICVFSLSNILEHQTFEPVNVYPYSQEADGRVSTLHQISEDDYLGMGLFDKGKFLLKQQGADKYVHKYPSDVEGQVNPFFVHQGALHINRTDNLVIYHSPFGFYLQVFSIAGSNMELLFEKYRPYDYTIIDGEFLLTENTPCGINAADFANGNFFFLYSGRTMKEYKNRAPYCDKILVYNENGKEVCKYLLDRDVAAMCMNSKERKIYVVSLNPETSEHEVGYYLY